MSNFKIGEKVVCVEPNTRLIKGEIYTIDGFKNCACGKLNLILKEIEENNLFESYCDKCGHKDIFRLCSAWRFRKLDYAHTERICAEIIESLKVNEPQLN